MRYASAAAFRHAIDDKLRLRAAEGDDPMRIRRQIVFERVLARLTHHSPGRWVLKGGVALEARFRDRARATKDLDLAVAGPLDGDALHTVLVEALATDPDGDFFVVILTTATELAADQAGRPGWRLTVRAELSAKEFATVHIDVVARADEIAQTERIVIPNSLSFADLPAVEIDSVDPAQHFAEKLHAYTLERGGRENTRVKDLVDLVLLVETGLEPRTSLRRTVDHVFATRGTHPVPGEIPAPPSAWSASYAGTATMLKLEATTLSEAARKLSAYWRIVPGSGD